MPIKHLFVLVFFVTACVMSNVAAAKNVVVARSSFASGSQGWTSNRPDEVTWQSTGGKLNGFLQSEDKNAGDTFAIAPAKFHGSYRSLNKTGKITFYHRVIAETNANGYVPYQVQLSGPGGSATWTQAAPTGLTDWVLVIVPLKQKLWTVTSGTWSGLLRNVTDLEIMMELADNASIPGDTDIEGIDEVRLVNTAPD